MPINSPEALEKNRLKHLGSKNGMWKGDKVGTDQLHAWVTKRLPKTTLCQGCQIQKPYDLANITGNYTRDLNNWMWLCRKCHMLSDGRLNNLIPYRSFEERSNAAKKGHETKKIRRDDYCDDSDYERENREPHMDWNDLD